MKNLTLVYFCLLICGNALAQSTTGLIAHWNMNGNATDVSGNGHIGRLQNVTPDTGIDGIPNTAYRFNGVNSCISTAYAPDLNLDSFSICAIIKVKGFYSGNCQGNAILTRGAASAHTVGCYTLYYDDNHYDSSCTNFDSSKQIFFPSAYNLVPTSYYVSTYTPTIVSNRWYKVVATFNGSMYRTYVNGVLKNISPIPVYGHGIGISTDSLSIGYNSYEAGRGYPYPVNGIIDDIMLYNRVLSDTEISHYGDSCGRITLQPVRVNFRAGGNATYSVGTTTTSAAFQWQTDAGTGFVNLSNAGPYSGVTTNTLHITGATLSMANYRYRCLISNPWGCNDTSNAALLTTGIEELTNESEIILFPNPATTMCSVILPLAIGKVQIFDQVGQMVKDETITSKRTDLNIDMLNPGIYVVRIECNGRIFYRRLLKS